MKSKMNINNLRLYFRIFVYIILLSVLYTIEVPWPVVIFLGFLFLILILLKSKLYKKIDSFFTTHFPFLSEQKPWIRKVIIIITFILIYMAIKQIIYAFLGFFGVDVQRMISDSINQSWNR
jgi:hypothetical protein